MKTRMRGTRQEIFFLVWEVVCIGVALFRVVQGEMSSAIFAMSCAIYTHQWNYLPLRKEKS